MILACSYCRHQLRGDEVGRELSADEYKEASHGACASCIEDFEAGFAVETIVARAKARAQRLAVAGAS
jgi:hypothetical protein